MAAGCCQSAPLAAPWTWGLFGTLPKTPVCPSNEAWALGLSLMNGSRSSKSARKWGEGNAAVWLNRWTTRVKEGCVSRVWKQGCFYLGNSVKTQLHNSLLSPVLEAWEAEIESDERFERVSFWNDDGLKFFFSQAMKQTGCRVLLLQSRSSRPASFIWQKFALSIHKRVVVQTWNHTEC